LSTPLVGQVVIGRDQPCLFTGQRLVEDARRLVTIGAAIDEEAPARRNRRVSVAQRRRLQRHVAAGQQLRARRGTGDEQALGRGGLFVIAPHLEGLAMGAPIVPAVLLVQRLVRLAIGVGTTAPPGGVPHLLLLFRRQRARHVLQQTAPAIYRR